MVVEIFFARICMARAFFSFLMGLLFMVVALPTVILWGIVDTYLNFDFYDDAFVEEVYEVSADYLTDEIARTSPELGIVIGAERTRKIILESFDQNVLHGILLSVLRQLQTPGHEVIIDLKPVQEQFATFVDRVAIAYLSYLPICAEGANGKTGMESAKLAESVNPTGSARLVESVSSANSAESPVSGFRTGVSTFPSCVSPVTDVKPLTDEIGFQLQKEIISAIPPSVTFSNESTLASIDMIKRLAWLMTAITIFLLILFSFIQYPCRERIMMALSAALVAMAAVLLLLIFLVTQTLIGHLIESLPHHSRQLVNLIKLLISYPVYRIIFYAGAFLVLGGAGFLLLLKIRWLRRFLKKRQERGHGEDMHKRRIFHSGKGPQQKESHAENTFSKGISHAEKGSQKKEAHAEDHHKKITAHAKKSSQSTPRKARNGIKSEKKLKSE